MRQKKIYFDKKDLCSFLKAINTLSNPIETTGD